MDTSPPAGAPQEVDRRFTGFRDDRYPSIEALRTAAATTSGDLVHDAVGGSAEMSMVKEESASGNGELAHLFERARRALASRLRQDPKIAEAFALLRSDQPRVAPRTDNFLPIGVRQDETHLAAQLTIDDQTHQVILRVVDVQTHHTVREFDLAALVAAVTRIGKTVRAGRAGDSMTRPAA